MLLILACDGSPDATSPKVGAAIPAANARANDPEATSLEARVDALASGADEGRSAEARLLDELLALGYLEGSRPAHAREGVVLNDPERASPGLNLLVSGHGPEALLFDMAGHTLHRWRLAYGQVWPRAPKQNWFRGDRYFRRAHVQPNGDLFAIFDGLGLIKIDRDSRLIWQRHESEHHDLHVQPDGSVAVLAHRPRIIPAVHPSNQVLEDFVVLLDPNGEVTARVSLYEAVARSEWSHWLEDIRDAGDIFHTNTVEILDGSLAHISPAFSAGNALISIHGLNAIAVVDPAEAKVVWGLRGDFKLQHQPVLLASGHVLLFDNVGGRPGHSRILEIDVATEDVAWSYEADDDDEFFSFCCGSVQRLANGNTLITDTDHGAAFEITRSGEQVWRYQSPYRSGEDPEKVASLFEVVRLEAMRTPPWANGGQIQAD